MSQACARVADSNTSLHKLRPLPVFVFLFHFHFDDRRQHSQPLPASMTAWGDDRSIKDDRFVYSS